MASCSRDSPASGSKTIRLLLTNAFGLQSKFGEFRRKVAQEHVDLAIVTETKFSPDKVTEAEADIPGFSTYRLDRNAHGFGGVGIWARSSLAVSRLDFPSSVDHELLWLSIKTQGDGRLVVGAVYRPGSSAENDVPLIEHFRDQCLANLTRHNTRVLLAGDFNVHNTDWLGSTKTTLAGEYLEDVCSSHGLTQHANQPTRGQSILDLIISDCSSTVPVNYCCPLGKSDHCVLLAELPLIDPGREEKSSRRVWRYHHADWGRLCNYYNTYDWSEVITDNPELSCQQLSQAILDGMAKFIPSRMLVTKPSHPVWWGPECTAAVSNKERTSRHWRKAPYNEKLKSDFISAVQACVETLSRSREKHQQAIRNKLPKGGLRDKEWWTTIKRVGNDSNGSEIPMLVDNGCQYASGKEKADCFGLHFSKKCSLRDNDLSDNPTPMMQSKDCTRAGYHSLPDVGRETPAGSTGSI